VNFSKAWSTSRCRICFFRKSKKKKKNDVIPKVFRTQIVHSRQNAGIQKNDYIQNGNIHESSIAGKTSRVNY